MHNTAKQVYVNKKTILKKIFSNNYLKLILDTMLNGVWIFVESFKTV